MAIWRRARDIKSGERSVGTRAILDDDAFLECHTERLGDHAANRIAGAAGAEHGNEGDRLAGIVVGEKRRAEQCRRCGHENETQFFMRGSSLAVASFYSLTRRSRAGAALSICAIEHSRSRQPLLFGQMGAFVAAPRCPPKKRASQPIHCVGTMPSSLAAPAIRARCCAISAAKSAGPPKLGTCPVR